ncbi:MAG: (Fe-S)-binding protein [Anaerolineae bacterium]|jgi:Fe-S oxidoreductase|nr:(Fe-S)-binding protein [Anaerolineae bacterium]MBT3713841.1 (Fe-S)-binding protein [Anaerolineae bacterium]MBT4308943.1 (Fe-S)-binding protein [Anaerolineae bacterium]MBT4457383.1 (Fe-S)-binding protein [Anaerolineae bacterium]MBT4842925.1 (Fe-S)-binding protein [Anaerolineae bacterium]
MADTATVGFTTEFYNSLFDVADGEKLKTCLQCADCSGICPFGYLMDFPPGRMIAWMRAGILDEMLESDSVWMCVSCYACTEVCPKGIPLTPGLMTRAKEELLLAGNIPAELQSALEFSQRYGNPLGESPRKRAAWTEGLDFDIPIMRKAKRPVDVLWFVGDYASYHPRVQETTIAFAKLLNNLGIDFGILGPEENSDGDSQRLAGERGLFEMLAEKNGKAFGKYEFGEIITTDPHAYNAIKNEYPQLGIEYPVRHYTEFLAERIEDIKPLLKDNGEKKVTYHDPCYLGRANDIYDAPRALLEAIPGVEIVEMAHTKSTSLCCGGGGGGMWLDGFQWEKGEVRLSDWRVKEAVTAEAEVLAVACPYEPPRFEDSTKTIEGAEKITVRDILELLIEAIE